MDTTMAAYRSSSSGNSNKPVKFYHCKETGHVISHCKKRNYCNYCKKDGQIILECHKKSGSVKRSTPYKAFHAMTRDVGTQHNPETQNAPQLFDRNDIYKMVQDSLAASFPNAISTALTATYSGTTYDLDPFLDNDITSINTNSSLHQDDYHNVSLNSNNQPPAPQNIINPIRRSSHHAPPPSRYGYSTGEYGQSYALLTTLNSIVVPNAYITASGQKCWEDAMNEELAALEENDI
ncbi:hypothetical protein BC332_19087 [Capsicum chinense]|nr:hypothetical protein BC332_19087 [Capsicum chinense]